MGTVAAAHRDAVVRLAAQHHVPTIYPFGYYAHLGGLVSYGVNGVDLWRRAAVYVDRILRGDKPADLPVQAPTKFELVINLKTAKALGLDSTAHAPRPCRRGHRMRRRAFIAGFAGVVAWPLISRAEATVPVVGYLSGAPQATDGSRMRAFLQGLSESGYVEGRNVAVEYRWGEGNFEKFSGLAADLVRSKVDLIATIGGIPLALAAKAATSTIPIVFGIGADPVEAGLVASLNHPGGNMTGVTAVGSELYAKRVELLHELVPTTTAIALLVSAGDPGADAEIRAAQGGARSLGLKLHVLTANTTDEIDTAFRRATELRAGGLIVSAGLFFSIEREQIVARAAQHSIATVYPWRESVAAGGLMSYGANLLDNYRLVGVYAGKILHGTNPADLPVEQAVKVELLVNLKAAKTLGLEIPQTLLARADEVIE